MCATLSHFRNFQNGNVPVGDCRRYMRHFTSLYLVSNTQYPFPTWFPRQLSNGCSSLFVIYNIYIYIYVQRIYIYTICIYPFRYISYVWFYRLLQEPKACTHIPSISHVHWENCAKTTSVQTANLGDKHILFPSIPEKYPVS